LSAKTQPVFQKKQKNFLKNCLSQKYPLTYSHWERAFGDSNPEKRQKNLPTGNGGQGYSCKDAGKAKKLFRLEQLLFSGDYPNKLFYSL